MVAAGLTACVPPLGCTLNVLPSEPVNVMDVAFVAVTVSVEELPAAIEAGLAPMVTVGIAGGGAAVEWPDPQAVTSKSRGRMNSISRDEAILLREPTAQIFIAVFCSLDK